MDVVLKPFRVVSSKHAQRAYLTTFLLGSGSLFLLFPAFCAYLVFYINYVPHIGVGKPVYLQYGDRLGGAGRYPSHPTGTVHFHGEIIPNQAYDVTLFLRLPTSPANLDAGNFMADLTIYSTPPTSPSPVAVAHARRPGIMTYRTPLLYTIDTILKSPLLLFGLTREEEALRIKLLERTTFNSSARHAIIRIEAPHKLDVYEARVEFLAHLTGIRWLMHRYKFTMFFVAPLVFWGVECVAMALVWWAVYSYCASSAPLPQRDDDGEAEEMDGTGDDIGITTWESTASVAPDDMYADDEKEEDDEILLKSDIGDSGFGSSLSESTARAMASAESSRKRGPIRRTD